MPRFTLLDSRSRNGNEVSSDIVVPVGTQQVILTAEINLPDKLDVLNSLQLDCERSGDGITWAHLAGFGWRGGAGTGKGGTANPDPSLRLLGVAGLVGQRVRVRVSLPRSITLGVFLDTL